MFVIDGLGLTVTVTVNGDPVQLPEVGVTVNVAVWEVLVEFVNVPVILFAPLPIAPPVNPADRVGAGQE
jgi:hypothetical protein